MVAGVASSASMVPRSHSRDMTSAVSSVPIIVITMAMAPGTSVLRLCNSGLNQKRCFTVIAGEPVAPAPRACNHSENVPCI